MKGDDLKLKGIAGFFVRMFKTRYGQISFHFVDYTIMSYVFFMGVLVIPFHHDVPHWGFYPFFHIVLLFLILEFLRWYTKRPTKILRFFRTFYPAFALPFAWSELNNFVTMIFPYWANDFVVNLDLRIFGVHPTVWVEKLFRPWLTELMNFFYAFYFCFIPIGGLSLYLRKREKETLDFMFLVSFTYSISFILFLFFPAEGPWVILKNLHTVKPTGGFFLKLNQFVQGRGSIRGGCFPSSHVAAAFTIVWATFRYQWKLGIVLLPFAFGVAAATVYCRYHHGVDALSGMIFGTILYGVGVLILKQRDRRKNLSSKITQI